MQCYIGAIPPVELGEQYDEEASCLTFVMLTAVAKSKRSMSWSEAYDTSDDFRYSEEVETQEKRERNEKLEHEDNCR